MERSAGSFFVVGGVAGDTPDPVLILEEVDRRGESGRSSAEVAQLSCCASTEGTQKEREKRKP